MEAALEPTIPQLSEQKRRRTKEGFRFAALLTIFVLGTAMIPLVASVFQIQLLTSGLILGISAMSFALLAGYGGMVSMAQMAFYGMASYAIAITTKSFGWPHAASIPFAIVCAISLAALFGTIAVRAQGVYFLIMTLALLQVFYGVAMQWQTMTGGYNGIAGIERPAVFGLSLSEPAVLFYAALASAILVYLLLRRMLQSPFGLILQGIKDNPTRMSALGVRVQFHRWLMIVISGGVSGVAGILGTYNHGAVNPDVAGLSVSVLVILSALLGGVSNLFRPMIAAVLVTFLVSVASYTMQQFFGTSRYWTLIGAIFIVVVVVRENDVLRRVRGLLPFGWRFRLAPEK